MDTIILKYSQTPGTEPVPNQLLTGEPAMNTYDGRLFMKKSDINGDAIVSFVNFDDLPTATVLSASFSSTASFVTALIQDVSITGSINISGSSTQVGNNTIFGNTLLSGSLTISGSVPGTGTNINIYGDTSINGAIKFLPSVESIDSSVSASYIYVSGSTNDLYFTQNGNGYANTTRLRWLEGNLYTGLLNGGVITATTGSTTFNISSGSGIIVTINASLVDNPYPTIKYVNWGNKIAQPLLYRTSSIQTFIGIDRDGNIIQQTSPWNDGQYNTSISIGTVLHQNKSTINASITYPNVAYGYKQRTYDFIKAFGPLKLSGLSIIPSGSLGITIGSGTAWAEGRNYQVDPNNPSYIIDGGTSVSKIFRYYQSGSEFVQDTNNALGYTSIDPGNYNPNGSGSLQAVPGTGANREFSLKRIFWYPNSATKGIVVYYGTKTYPTLVDAVANIQYEGFYEVENTKQNAVYLGAIAIRNDGDFTDPTSYSILPGGIFRSVGGSGGGGTAPSARLIDLADVTTTSITDGQPLAYDSALLKWRNQSYISASVSGTSSYSLNALTSSFASYSPTSSFANNFTVAGTLTAQKIVAVTISASTEYSSGSNRFGNDLTNTQTFTGSVGITGSLLINGTSSLVNTGTINYIPKIIGTSSFANSLIYESGSFISIGHTLPTAKLDVSFTPSVSTSILKFAGTTTVNDNFTLSNATANNNVFVPIFQYKATSYGYGGGANLYPAGIYGGGFIANVDDVNYPAGTGGGAAMHFSARNYDNTNKLNNRYLFSFANYTTTYLAITAGGNILMNTTVDDGYRLDVSGKARVSSGLVVTGSLNATGGITGSLLGTASTASFVTLAQTASYVVTAQTASYVLNAVSSSYTVTASYVQTAQTASYVATAISSSYPFIRSGSSILTFNTSNSNIDESFLVGNNAGYQATGSWDLVSIGTRAGYQAYSSQNVVALGYEAGYQAEQSRYSVFIGESAGYQSTINGTTAWGKIFIGASAGYASQAEYSQFIGYNAGILSDAKESNFIGLLAGNRASSASGSNFLGSNVGQYQYSSSYSNFIGYNVANNDFNPKDSILGRNNIIIGTSITLPNGSKDSINIGGILFGTGSYFPDTDPSTIMPPYSGSSNGKIGINVINPKYSLDVSGSGNYTNGLTITGSLSVTGSTHSLYGNVGIKTLTPTASFEVNGASKVSGGEILSYTQQLGNTVSTNYVGSLVQAPDYTNAATSNVSYLGTVSSIGAVGSNTGTTTVVGGAFIARAYGTSTGQISVTGIQAFATRNNASDISTNANNSLIGATINVGHQGSVTSAISTSIAYGILNNLTIARGTVTTLTGQYISPAIGLTANSTALVTTFYGLRIGSTVGATSGTGSGAITSYYDLYLEGATIQATGTVTNKFGVYQLNASYSNYFAGNVGIGKIASSSLDVSGSVLVTGSLNVSGGITGSLQGIATTASFVTTAQTASYVLNAQTASYVVNSQTASFVTLAQTASYVLQAVSSSYATTASYVLGTSATSSYAISSSNAITASYANTAPYSGLLGTVPTWNQNTTGQAGSVANAVTFTNTGGATPGTTYNGSATRTIDYTTLGAQATSSILTSLAGLSYTAGSFVKMTGANTFSLDTNTYYSSSNPSGFTNNTGTVTTVSVASANGFAGTVATASTTPAITLSTTITGLLKGNGTAISAATAGTDYQAALTGTGFVKSTAGTISYDTNTYYSSSNPNGYTSNTGTVTSVSVVNANGVSGTVATATTTPAITLTLGAITPTSVNGLTFTSASSGFTIAGGATSKTLTVSNTLTLAGTDASTLNIGSGGTLGTAAFTAATAYQASSTNLTSVSNLSYVTSSFVKMTGANTFTLDTNTYYSSSNPSGYTSNTGTVTTVSVVSANGLAGTVATAGTTPAITLSTTITGLLKGNGTAISAAVSGTDYQAPLTGTGFVKSTAGTISYDTNTYYSSSNPNGYTTNTGTVTSVGGTGTVSGLTLTGTVTTTGNLTLGGTLAVTPSNFSSQTANTFLAAPNGSAGVPTFRTIAAADIPTLNQNTTGTAATASYVVTAQTASYVVTAQTASYAINATGSFVQGGNSFGVAANIGTNDLQNLILETNNTSRLFISSSNGFIGIAKITPSAPLDVNGNTLITGSLIVTTGITGSLLGTASYASNADLLDGLDSTAFARTTSNSFVGTQSITGSLNVTGSLAVGAFFAATMSGENTLTIGLPPAGGVGEGGQILLQASGGLYTSASMLDNYQNKFRLLRGTNLGSDAELFSVNLSTGLVTTSGSLVVGGTMTENSSIRYKKDIFTITSSLDIINQLRGVTYTKKSNGAKEIGLIAEEVNKIIPELVQYDSNNEPDSIAYPRIVALLIEAVKELSQEVQLLKNK